MKACVKTFLSVSVSVCVCVCVCSQRHIAGFVVPATTRATGNGSLFLSFFHDSIDLMSSSSQFFLELTLFTNSRPPLFSEMQQNDDEKVTLKNILPLHIFFSLHLSFLPLPLYYSGQRGYSTRHLFFLTVLWPSVVKLVLCFRERGKAEYLWCSCNVRKIALQMKV